jgi:AAA15 family ATPase/GTPase
MLIEFSVENYLSFKDLNTLTMMEVKAFKEHQESNTFEIGKDERLLKSACIYGNNASGKSNLLDSVDYMKRFVLNSFRDALLEDSELRFPLRKFKLNEKSLNEPSYFEVVFIKNNIKYRYGYELDYDRVVNEWLYRTKSREVPLFIRKGQDFEINNSSFSEGEKLDTKTKENVLFLTLVAQLNGEISNSVIDWFKSLNTISGIHDISYKRYTTGKLKEDEDFKKWVTEFVNFLEITDIAAGEKEVESFELEDLDEENTEEELINIISNLRSLAKKNPKRDELITWHNMFNEDDILTKSVPFDFDREESEGTKKFIHLLGPWYDSLKNGKVLLVDELDSRLHTLLTLKLVQLFHKNNQSNAQIIFAAHDTNLLDKTIFRRDQIWFVEKNQFGSSELYSLSDFKSSSVRKNTAFEKNYMMGKYGAIPYIESEDKLADLIYG